MNNALVLYEGKHGTAEKTAQVIAAMLANAKCLSIEDAPQEIEAYRSVITVFSFYGFDTALQTKAFLRRQRERMQGRNLIAVGVGLAKNDFPAYLSALAEATGRAADRTCFVPGQLRLSSLSPNDLKALQAFSQKAGMPLMDRGEFKVQDAIDAAEQLACHLSRSPAPMEPGQLLKEIKRYILAHNTLALATGTGDFVRCTPLEYQYQNGFFYIITEGGLKMKGILANHQVSMAIYEPYEGMEKLHGLQVSGQAEIVPLFSKEYVDVFRVKKLPEEAIKQLPVDLHLIKIVPNRFEFLNSEFKEGGFDTRQVIGAARSADDIMN